MSLNLATNTKISWCPGCPNSAILVAFRQTVEDLCGENKLKIENLVAAAGVGCHGKIADYLNINTFNSLHGRVVPTMTGIKLGNPDLTVVGFSGDGDSFSEGFSHVMHAAQRNSDVTLFMHNNQVFALTTGQATSTSPKGFKGGSTPFGNTDEPLNPALMMLAAGASFVARAFASDIEGTKKIMRAAIDHKGFSFVDIIQPCITFFDTRQYYKERVYWIENHDHEDLGAAINLARVSGDRVPLGVLYDVTRPTFEDNVHALIR